MTDSQPSPSEFVSRKEEWEFVKSALSDEERQVFDLRAGGLRWDEVAERLGGAGQARRMQLSRALERIERRLEAAK